MISNITQAKQYSEFLSRWLIANPEWENWLLHRIAKPIDRKILEAIFQENLDTLLTSQLAEQDFCSALRIARQKTMMYLGVRDLTDQATLCEVMQGMSDMAEIALAYASDYAKQQMQNDYGLPYYPDGSEMNIWIIGMGKLGACELNVSSDIDLIFIYDVDGQTTGGEKSLSHHEWFSRLGKRIIKYLSEITAQGFVFRVDMRLRPNGDSGPLVCSLDMLEEYFLVQGREWERYAWIKARLVYPLGIHQQNSFPPSLNSLVRSFVYRRYLDYGIIDSIRKLHSQIRHEANLRSHQFPDRSADVKLGKGGIREIEFLAQMFQLIRGGQEPILRSRSTLDVLNNLVILKLMDDTSVLSLQEAYYFFRKLEHRLQWRSDAQIHYLPTDPAAILRVSNSMGFEHASEFHHHLLAHQEFVANAFAQAFVLDGQSHGSSLKAELGHLSMYPEFSKRLEAMQQTKRYVLATEVTKENIECILLYILDRQPPVAEKTLLKVINFLESIFRRSSYISLLKEYPMALDRVIHLLESSAWGADYVIAHPHLLDELIQTQTEYTPEQDPNQYWSEWAKHLRLKLDEVSQEDGGQELMWNLLRDMHHAEIFRTLLADLGIGAQGRLAVELISDRLSCMADIIIQETLTRIWQSMMLSKHLEIDFTQSGFGVIAYGKLGGKELGYGSDLDLVFIFDDTQVQKPSHEMVELFMNLARRLISWLTTATSSGVLFDIDTRLRPNGVAGLMVSSLSAYEAYQRREGVNTAWVWEHQALTRARFCAGDHRIGKRFEEIRSEVLSLYRDPKSLRQEILAMREKLHAGHPNRSDHFDLKHDSGGMVDIEFMTQYLVLAWAYRYPSLVANVGNIALLGVAARVGLIDTSLSDRVAQAYRDLRKRQHELRLEGKQIARVGPNEITEPIQLARDAVRELWQEVMQPAL